jgi:hypothetical protein
MITIQYQWINRRFDIEVREKTFKTEAAVASWIVRQEARDDGAFVRVLRSEVSNG